MVKIYFNTNLEYLRKRKNLKQEELANLLGVTEGVISHWETGKRQPSNMEMVGKIAEFFDVGADIITKDLRLSTEDDILISKVKLLSERDKKIVSNLVDNMKD